MSIVLVGGCKDVPEVTEEIIRPVRYAIVDSGTGGPTRAFSGSVSAASQTNVSFKVDGTIQRIHVKVGDALAPGDMLMELDASDYRIQVQEAQAGLQQAKAQAQNARASYARVRKLYEVQSVAKSDLDAARAASKSADAAVEGARQRSALANRRMTYTKIVASTAASVAAVHVDANENVRAGQTVVELTGKGALEVLVAIPSTLITKIESGAAVKLQVDATGEAWFGGRVVEVGVASTRAATTFPVTVRFDEQPAEIRPGMAARVQFELPAQTGSRIVVPSFAVREGNDGQRFVFVVEPAANDRGIVRKTVVVLGGVSADGLEIIEGLKGGERVVTAGVSRLSDGQEVLLSVAYQMK